jgi:hypothetical protein
VEIWEVITIQKRLFYSQNNGVIGLPIYLTVVAVILCIGLYVVSGSLYDVLQARDRHKCEEGVSRVLTEAVHLFTYGDKGATAALTLVVPGSIRLLVFGGLPTTDAQILHDSHTSANYYYVGMDGSLWTGHVQARLCGSNVSSPTVFTAGTYHLTLTLLDAEEGLYVSISS